LRGLLLCILFFVLHKVGGNLHIPLTRALFLKSWLYLMICLNKTSLIPVGCFSSVISLVAVYASMLVLLVFSIFFTSREHRWVIFAIAVLRYFPACLKFFDMR
jgi:ABC-type protease/lipase transport system fused ATPase/permease subunit